MEKVIMIKLKFEEEKVYIDYHGADYEHKEIKTIWKYIYDNTNKDEEVYHNEEHQYIKINDIAVWELRLDMFIYNILCERGYTPVGNNLFYKRIK